ncbi:hypothetical protein L596_002265 [Steinernema carpocapsae]|uniref:Uncharacterized protein n=1 Tax=Steinernema carpocapsae TaxID=34508 RepID=A0A4V6I7C6_STECR|nr:hypothetical protein L596_002265 [Steinernema carpocapsae]
MSRTALLDSLTHFLMFIEGGEHGGHASFRKTPHFRNQHRIQSLPGIFFRRFFFPGHATITDGQQFRCDKDVRFKA